MDGGPHSPGDGFAMQEAGVARFGFESVTEGVPEIQDAAAAGLFLVARHDLGFDAHGFGNDVIEHVGGLSKDVSAALGEQAEERLTGDNAGLNDFVKAGMVFAGGEGGEHGGIDQRGERLVEAADQVLARDEVGTGLAADRSVDLGEEGGGDLNYGNAAHEDGGKETAEIGDDAAADGDDEAGTVGAALGHLIGKGLHVGHALGVFPALEEQDFEVALAEGGSHLGAVKLPDVGGGDDENASAAGRDGVAEAGEDASLDVGGV